MNVKKPQESQEQKQNRIRAQAENTRAIQEGVADRTVQLRRRANPRKSLITNAVTRAI